MSLHNELMNYIENAAQSHRGNLPKEVPTQTYQVGFDVGYSLGHAHAYEDIVNRIGAAEQKKNESGGTASNSGSTCNTSSAIASACGTLKRLVSQARCTK